MKSKAIDVQYTMYENKSKANISYSVHIVVIGLFKRLKIKVKLLTSNFY